MLELVISTMIQMCGQMAIIWYIGHFGLSDKTPRLRQFTQGRACFGLQYQKYLRSVMAEKLAGMVPGAAVESLIFNHRTEQREEKIVPKWQSFKLLKLKVTPFKPPQTAQSTGD